MASVYVSGAVSGDQSKADIIQKMIELFLEMKLKILGEHQKGQRPEDKLAGLGWRQDFSVAARIERACRMEINKADYFVAEFSAASTGVGREIEYAYNRSKQSGRPLKSLCVFQMESAAASPMIIGMNPSYYENVTICGYSDWSNLADYLRRYFDRLLATTS